MNVHAVVRAAHLSNRTKLNHHYAVCAKTRPPLYTPQLTLHSCYTTLHGHPVSVPPDSHTTASLKDPPLLCHGCFIFKRTYIYFVCSGNRTLGLTSLHYRKLTPFRYELHVVLFDQQPMTDRSMAASAGHSR